MAVDFTVELYVSAERTPGDLVEASVEALRSAGFEYRGLRRPGTSTPTDDGTPTLEDACGELARDLGERLEAAGASDEPLSPGLAITFHFPADLSAEHEEVLRERKALDDARTLALEVGHVPADAGAVPDLPHRTVALKIWEEYVLAYGDRERHERNLDRLLDAVRALHDACEPFFGWGDGSLNAPDHSYATFAREGRATGNRVVVVGERWMDSLDREATEEAGGRIEDLDGTGALVVNPSSYGLSDVFGRE